MEYKFIPESRQRGVLMTYQLFFYEEASLSPEQRWLLWQWSRHIGLEHATTCSVRSLLAQLQMPLDRGQTTLRSLKKSRVIEAILPPTLAAKGRGRPSYTYRVAPSFLEKLPVLPHADLPLSEHIERVSRLSMAMVADTTEAETTASVSANDAAKNVGTPADTAPSSPRKAGEGEAEADEEKEPLSSTHPNLSKGHARKKQLTLVNRWVLVVLLANANANGVVMGLSQSRLQRLTGLSLNRLHSQRRKLEDLGVLDRYVPGRGGRLQGHTLNALYYLDLSHPSVVCLRGWALSVELWPAPPRRGHYIDTSLCEAIVAAMFEAVHTAGIAARRAQYRRAKSVLPEEDYAQPAWDIVRALPQDRHLALCLRSFVHQAATRLLTTAWQALLTGNAGRDTPVEAVLEALTSALAGAEWAGGARTDDTDAATSQHAFPHEDGQTPSTRSDSDNAALAMRLYVIACHLADTLQQDLLRWQSGDPNAALDLGTLTYRLTPVSAFSATRRAVDGRMRYWRLMGEAPSPGSACGPEATAAEAPILFSVSLHHVPLG